MTTSSCAAAAPFIWSKSSTGSDQTSSVVNLGTVTSAAAAATGQLAAAVPFTCLSTLAASCFAAAAVAPASTTDHEERGRAEPATAPGTQPLRQHDQHTLKSVDREDSHSRGSCCSGSRGQRDHTEPQAARPPSLPYERKKLKAGRMGPKRSQHQQTRQASQATKRTSRQTAPDLQTQKPSNLAQRTMTAPFHCTVTNQISLPTRNLCTKCTRALPTDTRNPSRDPGRRSRLEPKTRSEARQCAHPQSPVLIGMGCLLLLLCVVVAVVCVLLLLLLVVGVLDTNLQAECLCQQTLRMKLCRSPRWQRNLHHRGFQKTGSQLRDNPEEREKCVSAAENPSHRHMTASRNNVQIFKCGLRREVRVHHHVENM